MPNAQNSTIQITISKKFITAHLSVDGNKATIMLFNVTFNNVFNKFFVLSSPNIHQRVQSQ